MNSCKHGVKQHAWRGVHGLPCKILSITLNKCLEAGNTSVPVQVAARMWSLGSSLYGLGAICSHVWQGTH